MILIATGDYDINAPNLIKAANVDIEVSSSIIRELMPAIKPVPATYGFLKTATPEQLFFLVVYGVDSLMTDVCKELKKDDDKR